MIPLKTFQNLSAEKQKNIIEKALYEFAEKGYQRASINSIVQSIGIAKGSIYQYFGDKEALFLYIFSNSMEMVKDYLRTVRDQTQNEALEIRLEKNLMAGVNFIKEKPVVYRLYIKILAEASMPFREEILLSLRQYSFNYINSFLECSKKKGELKDDIDITKAVFIIEAVMDKFLLSRALKNNDCGLGIFNGDEKTIKDWINSLVKILCNGITL